jgi:hypothetical protein
MLLGQLVVVDYNLGIAVLNFKRAVSRCAVCRMMRFREIENWLCHGMVAVIQ